MISAWWLLPAFLAGALAMFEVMRWAANHDDRPGEE